ncbi:hypothetical protein [Duganella aceris]|uniref:Secreted protein n=1 Tax=Duganella aceris TaxID=2703883 RepID=A0ABX0FHE8_9BURK|nr:hypothetical protein [Duganella aceris]NGZ83987.1 hypothetical protein [Duganella aceris]
MNAPLIKAVAAAALCLAATAAPAQAPPKEVVHPTGTTGATAFQPDGSGKAEAEAGSRQLGNAGMQPPERPGFDNKPPKGAKADCLRPEGGVDASGGENIQTASKDNTTCTGNSDKKTRRD